MWAQLLHAVASGTFAFLMSWTPTLVLPTVVPEALPLSLSEAPSDVLHYQQALMWARVMGVSEFMMTWTYAISGFVEGMEAFATLSVVTRIGATLVLWFGYWFRVNSLQQALGVLPDCGLAVVTWVALQIVYRHRQVELKQL